MAAKNKYDYLSTITLILSILAAVIPFAALFVRAYTTGIVITDVLPILAPAVAVGPLSLLTIKFSSKANQTPLGLKLQAESKSK